METMKPHEAIEMMRKLTSINVPFSFEFESYNKTKDTSEGHKVVAKAFLRQGLRNNQSDRAKFLIGYSHFHTGEPRFFHIALLKKFNNYKIEP